MSNVAIMINGAPNPTSMGLKRVWAGVLLAAIRAVILRFWLPLRLMMRIQSARLGRGTGAVGLLAMWIARV
jgi:hypothetical protein